MIKHSYHAKLSIWHVVLLVIILAISLPVIAKPDSSSTALLKPFSHELPPATQTFWQNTHSGVPGLHTEFGYRGASCCKQG